MKIGVNAVKISFVMFIVYLVFIYPETYSDMVTLTSGKVIRGFIVEEMKEKVVISQDEDNMRFAISRGDIAEIKRFPEEIKRLKKGRDRILEFTKGMLNGLAEPIRFLKGKLNIKLDMPEYGTSYREERYDIQVQSAEHARKKTKGRDKKDLSRDWVGWGNNESTENTSVKSK